MEDNGKEPSILDLFPCPKGCGKRFQTHSGAMVHLSRSKIHGGGWSTNKKRPKYPSSSSAYKKAHYLKTKRANAAKGLNARGKPLKGRNMSEAMKTSWRERRERNGALPHTIKVSAENPHGDAATAILMAAQVIRAVTAGLKIGGAH